MYDRSDNPGETLQVVELISTKILCAKPYFVSNVMLSLANIFCPENVYLHLLYSNELHYYFYHKSKQYMLLAWVHTVNNIARLAPKYISMIIKLHQHKARTFY